MNCNGPNSEQNDIDMYFGKGLVSKITYENVYSKCTFPTTGKQPLGCDAAIEEVFSEVGPHK